MREECKGTGMTTLHEKVATLVSQWRGSDAKDQSLQQERLVTDLVELLRAEKAAKQGEKAMPYCAFCVPRQLDGMMNILAGGRRRMAS